MGGTVAAHKFPPQICYVVPVTETLQVPAVVGRHPPLALGASAGEAALLCRHALNFPNHLNPAHPHLVKREPLSAQILESRPEAAGVFAVRVAVREFSATAVEYASRVPGGTGGLWDGVIYFVSRVLSARKRQFRRSVPHFCGYWR